MNHESNLGTTERWLSLLGGIGMLLTTARGGAVSRVARGAVGLSLLARGASGYCAVKAALVDRMRRAPDAIADFSTSGRLDSMEGMYEAELQELHNAEGQLARLADDLARTMGHPELAFRMQEYATELQLRRVDLEGLLARVGARVRAHRDDAMHALIEETEKMWRVCAANMRDAAVTASVQRIIHYKIAGYGTIASYAKSLGREDDAKHFAQLADRDRAVDAELSDLAKGTLNPEATVAPAGEPPTQSARPH
jgi:ferritin-like metal-binding protein YciE